MSYEQPDQPVKTIDGIELIAIAGWSHSASLAPLFSCIFGALIPLEPALFIDEWFKPLRCFAYLDHTLKMT